MRSNWMNWDLQKLWTCRCYGRADDLELQMRREEEKLGGKELFMNAQRTPQGA